MATEIAGNAGTTTTTYTMPSDREIVAVRVFDAPRRLVWEAWTHPEHLPRWLLGPAGWSMPVCEIDLRPGGKRRFVWRNDADGTEFEICGVYQEIAPPERLVEEETMGSEGPAALNTMILTEENGRTTMTLTMLYPSKEVRDAALATGMTGGMDQSFDRLDDLLRQQV